MQMQTLAERVKAYIKVRWIFLLTLSLAGLLTQYIAEGLTARVYINVLVSTGALALNGVYQMLAHSWKNHLRRQEILAMALILTDIIAATFLVYSNGGVESRTIIIYAIPLVAAGAFFDRRMVYRLALLSGVLYNAVLLLDYFELIPRRVINDAVIHGDPGSMLIAAIFYPATMFMVGFVSDFVLTLLDQREAELEASVMALAESEKKRGRR